MKNAIVKLTGKLNRMGHITLLKLRQNGPKFALAGNIIFSAAAVGAAVWATNKVRDEGLVEELHAALDEVDHDPEATVADKTRVWVNKGGKIVAVYILPFGLWAASATCGIAGHVTMEKRLDRTTAALVAYQKAYDELIAKNPELNAKKMAEHVNKQKEAGEDDLIMDDTEHDPRVFHFNRETAFGIWEKDANYIRTKLENIRKTAQMIYDGKGFIMLSEVLEMCGMHESVTEESLVLGWLHDGKGNDTIDFGFMECLYPLFDIDSELVVKDLLLRFNCDWVVTDKTRDPKHVFARK